MSYNWIYQVPKERLELSYSILDFANIYELDDQETDDLLDKVLNETDIVRNYYASKR